MGRFLNVGLVQMPCSPDTVTNLKYFEEKMEILMKSYHKPDLVVGIECMETYTPEPIPGRITDFFSEIAKKYHVYLLPGTMYEESDDLPEERYYNTAPVFDPEGNLIGKYRKMAPWKPCEYLAEPGDQYFVFDIPEKDTKVGVQICYDLNFPEISRNETLMGAEVLVKMTMDPQELYRLNTHLHYARALENQAYLVSVNATGFFEDCHLYGHSEVISPEGDCLWEAGQEDSICTVTLDLDLVKRSRECGTMFMDHYLKHLYQYNFPMPYADDFRKAPVFRDLSPAPEDPEEYQKEVEAYGGPAIGRRNTDILDWEKMEKDLDEFFKNR